MSPDTVTNLIIQYKYWMLILLAFLEGPVTAFTGGLLAALGYLNPLIVFGILIGKDITVDGICFMVGRWGNHNRLVHHYSAKIGIKEEHWNTVEKLWVEKPWRTMFVSKLAYGLSLPFLVSAGLTGISYKKFWFYALQIGMLQYGFLMAVGYFLGSSFAFVKDAIILLQIGVAAVTVFFIAYYIFASYMRRRTIASNEKL